jgi:hypothetical protein
VERLCYKLRPEVALEELKALADDPLLVKESPGKTIIKVFKELLDL